GFGTWTSVSRVRVFGSRASAVRATLPANVRAGSSRWYTVAAWPAFIAIANTCGTFTHTRTVSVRIRWNSSRVVVGASAWTSAPGSMFRAVITPSNGAVIFWNDWRV